MSAGRAFSFLFSWGRWVVVTCVLAGVVLAPVFPIHAAVLSIRYVSPDGSDTGNDCHDTLHPCKTINQALSVASSGDHIYLDAGVYRESLVIAKDSIILEKDPDKACPRIVPPLILRPCPTIDGGGTDRVIHVTAQNVWLEHLTIKNGQVSNAAGPGILNEGTLYLDTVTVTNNHVTITSPDNILNGLYAGGGINNKDQGQLTVMNSTIANNSAYNGGGIFTTGSLTLIGSRIYSNTANDLGGGLENATCAAMTVQNTSFWDNQAQDGGGIYIYDDSHPEACSQISLKNVTVSANRAVHVYDGVLGVGGLRSSARVEIDHATFFDNQSTPSAPVDALLLEENQQSLNPPLLPSVVKNTIIAQTPGTPANLCNFMHPVPSGGHNLSSDASCSFTTPTDLQNIDPKLESLADNGGMVETCALMGKSPAIDRGGSFPNGRDARGVTPKDGNLDGVVVPDIGAYEFEPANLFIPIVRR